MHYKIIYTTDIIRTLIFFSMHAMHAKITIPVSGRYYNRRDLKRRIINHLFFTADLHNWISL